MSEQPKVAIVGVGTMGSVACRALLGSSIDVTVVDVDAGACLRLQDLGARVVDSAAEAANLAEIVLLSLPGPTEVRAVVSELTAAPRGTVVVDLSTIDPRTASACAEMLAPAGVLYVDSPVLGRPDAVGRWTLIASGATDAVDKARTVLVGAIAARMLHVGDIGRGSVIKLMNNLMFGAINAITAEVLAVSAAAGLSPHVFVDVVCHSDAASVSGLFKDIGPRIVRGDFQPKFAVELLHKDNLLANQLADEYRVPLIVGSSVHAFNTLALRQHAQEDSAALVRVLEDSVGITVRSRDPLATESGGGDGA